MKSLAFRQQIRTYELEQVLTFMPTNCSILEIGAGAGWQAKALAEKGFAVTAIDIAASNYRAKQIWPILEYDGKSIPFPDHTFDMIFSSNTLEHIPHIAAFMDEMRRVLKPGGIAIHLMPSGVWRFWTMVTHYAFLPYYLKKAGHSLLRRSKLPKAPITMIFREELYAMLVPERHGERGNVLTELYLFNRTAWLALFKKANWNKLQCYPNRLFYTGHGLLGEHLPLQSRRRLSSLLGSAGQVYVLQPGAVTTQQTIQTQKQPVYSHP